MDKRLLKIAVEVGDNLYEYSDLAISASGSKVTNQMPNEFTIKLTNLSKAKRDQILTETSVLDPNQPKKKIYVYAGRESYGTSLVFKGDIRMTVPSQPPDISITFSTFTGNSLRFENVSRSTGALTNLSSLSKGVASDLGVKLDFQATDKKIGSYAYTGSKIKEIEKLNEMGVNAYLDDDTLVVKDRTKPLTNTETVVNQDNGMIGIPTINERGISVKMLFNPDIKIGGRLKVESTLNPVAVGNWIIYKMTYDLTNRETNFYITAEATRES